MLLHGLCAHRLHILIKHLRARQLLVKRPRILLLLLLFTLQHVLVSHKRFIHILLDRASPAPLCLVIWLQETRVAGYELSWHFLIRGVKASLRHACADITPAWLQGICAL